MPALTGSLTPCGPAPQEDDPARREAQLHPLGALPAFLPARVVADLRVEPHAGFLRLQHPLVGGEVPRVVQRRGSPTPIDSVARAERLHRGGAGAQGGGDPIVAPALLDPTADVVRELPERNPLVYSHAPHRPLFMVPDSEDAAEVSWR